MTLVLLRGGCRTECSVGPSDTWGLQRSYQASALGCPHPLRPPLPPSGGAAGLGLPLPLALRGAARPPAASLDRGTCRRSPPACILGQAQDKGGCGGHADLWLGGVCRGARHPPRGLCLTWLETTLPRPLPHQRGREAAGWDLAAGGHVGVSSPAATFRCNWSCHRTRTWASVAPALLSGVSS